MTSNTFAPAFKNRASRRQVACDWQPIIDIINDYAVLTTSYGIHKIVTSLNAGCSNILLIFVHSYVIDLCNECFHHHLCLGMEPHTLLGIREGFGLDDLKFSIFIGQRDDVERIVVDGGAIGGREQYGDLRGGYALYRIEKWKERRTLVTTFPGASITSWEMT